MKKNRLNSMIFGAALLVMCGCTEEYVVGPDVIYENGNIVSGKELITYNILVACDKQSVDALSGGNATVHKQKVDEFLANAAKFINDAGQGQLRYEFKLEAPDELVIYDENSKTFWQRFEKEKADAGYDMILTMDGVDNYNEDYRNCQSANGNIRMCYKGDNGAAHDYFSGEDYKVLAHESGHALFGFADLYMTVIQAENNEVNGEGYEPVDIMNKQNKMSVWCDYHVAMINFGRIRGQENWETTVDNAKELKITAVYGGGPATDVKIKIYGGTQNNNGYGQDQGGWQYCGSIKKEYVLEDKKTGSDGTVIIPATDLYYKNLAPGIEFWRSVLIEAETDGKKGYLWIPYYEMQMPALESNGENLTYEASIEIK